MANTPSILDAIRRGYPELQESQPSEIIDYFNELNEDSFGGHVSNIKGIFFEQILVDDLQKNGVQAFLFEHANHPDSDIFIDATLEIDPLEFQVKSTDSVSYISSTLEDNPDIPIITTSEVASHFDDNSIVINSGVSNEDLTDATTDALSTDYDEEVGDLISDQIADNLSENLIEAATDSIFPFSPFWFLGLPF